MTIETTVNKTIQSGNGSNKDFDFAFEIPDEDSLSLTKRGSDGTETAITTNFTVTGIGDEAGGTVNYPTSGSALAANEKIIIKRVVALKQPENLRNQGDYSLEDIEDALDRAVMLCQQLQEQIDRSIVLNITSSQSGIKLDDLISNRLLIASSDGSKIEMSSVEYGSIDAYLSTLVAIADDISAVAAIDTEITTVAGIETEILAIDANEANINIVAAIDTEITTVAGIAANITSIAGNATNINTVAGIAAAVTSVAAIAANISTVAGIAADVTTVAGMESNIASVVANMASILNAASFGFPTLSSSDAGKFLQIKSTYDGYVVAEGMSRKNAIINGDFNIWQRGSSFVSVADQQYTADRWIYGKSGAMVHDISRITDVPTVAQAGRAFNYSLLIDCQTIDNSISATDYCVIEQRIEGYNFLPIAQKPLTLSFWVKATKIGIHCAYIKNSGADRTYVAEFTINASDTWEFKTINFPATPASGTWNYVNGIGLSIGFTLACGSNLQTTAGAWQNNGAIGSANQTNACDSTSNDFYLCGVQLEAGSVATPFESKSFQEELRLCQRYYRKSYNYATNPSTATATGSLVFSTGTNSCAGVYPFGDGMRAGPTVRYWDQAGNLSKITANGVDNTVIGAGGIGGEENHLFVDIAPTVAADKTIRFQFDASSEL